MIYTLTVNPCLDYYISMPTAIDIGRTNRADSAQIKAGGKGVNVSLALQKFGAKGITTLLAAGGKNGERIVREISDKGLDCIAFEADGESRINVKINSSDAETEINLKGPQLSDNVRNDIADYFSEASADDVVILAGSLPDKCPDDFYAQIISATPCRNVAVDCTKNVLRTALNAGVWLAKPNIDELSEFFGKKISWEQLPEYAKKLCKMGARYALVSAGAKGAVLATGDRVLCGYAPKGKAVCTTGAGDTMLAAFVYSLKECECGIENALKFAVAAGSAKAFCDGFAEIGQVQSLVDKVLVEEVIS